MLQILTLCLSHSGKCIPTIAFNLVSNGLWHTRVRLEKKSNETVLRSHLESPLFLSQIIKIFILIFKALLQMLLICKEPRKSSAFLLLPRCPDPTQLSQLFPSALKCHSVVPLNRGTSLPVPAPILPQVLALTVPLLCQAGGSYEENASSIHPTPPTVPGPEQSSEGV